MSSHNNTYSQTDLNLEEDTYFQEHQTYSLDNKDEDNNNKSLIKVEINIGNNQIKELDIISMNDIDNTINDFCIENNLPKEAEESIKKLIIEELDKKIIQCKLYFIIRFSRKYRAE